MLCNIHAENVVLRANGEYHVAGQAAVVGPVVVQFVRQHFGLAEVVNFHA